MGEKKELPEESFKSPQLSLLSFSDDFWTPEKPSPLPAEWLTFEGLEREISQPGIPPGGITQVDPAIEPAIKFQKVSVGFSLKPFKQARKGLEKETNQPDTSSGGITLSDSPAFKPASQFHHVSGSSQEPFKQDMTKEGQSSFDEECQKRKLPEKSFSKVKVRIKAYSTDKRNTKPALQKVSCRAL